MSLARLPIALTTLLLTACAAVQPGAVSNPGPAAESPEYGGTAYLTTVSPPLTVHPHSDDGLGNSITLGPVYESILTYDYSTGDHRGTYTILPAIAERWELADPTTYLFHIRQGARFHNGQEVTAEDVAWSMEFLRDPANKFRRSVLLRDADRIDAVGPSTVRVTSKKPLADFLSNFTGDFKVLPRKAVDAGWNMERETIGTGPFKLARWDRQSGATLTRNEAYWQDGKPYLERIQLTYGVEPSAAAAAFAAGRNDAIKAGDKVQFDLIKTTTPDARGATFKVDISDHLILKTDRAPFNDFRVRKAMHLALDRQEMINTLTFGLGTANPPGANGARGDGWSIPQQELLGLPGYRQPKDPDIAEAKRLLAEAGYPNGLRVPFMYNSGYTRYPGEAQVVAGQLQKSGFNLALEPRETAIAQKAELDGEFTMTFAQFRYKADGPDWPVWLHSRQAKGRAGIDEPDLDRLIDGQYGELDVEKRKKMWTDIQRFLLEKLYVVPLITQVGYNVYQPWVHGWTGGVAGQLVNSSWSDTWYQQDSVPPGR